MSQQEACAGFGLDPSDLHGLNFEEVSAVPLSDHKHGTRLFKADDVKKRAEKKHGGPARLREWMNAHAYGAGAGHGSTLGERAASGQPPVGGAP